MAMLACVVACLHAMRICFVAKCGGQFFEELEARLCGSGSSGGIRYHCCQLNEIDLKIIVQSNSSSEQ